MPGREAARGGVRGARRVSVRLLVGCGPKSVAGCFAGRLGSVGRVRFGKPDPAVGVCEMPREMFAVERLNSRASLPAPAKRLEQSQGDRVQLAQIDDQFG